MSQKTGPTGDWYKNSKNIEGMLLDISGVLTDSVEGGAVPTEGSVDAVKKYGTCQLNYYFGHKNAILSYHVCVITVRKRSLGQGNFFTPVCDSVHGGGVVSAPLHAGIHPPPRTRGRHPPMTRGRHPPGPEADTPPPGDYRIGSTSGRYASYWNAFLYCNVFKNCIVD